MKTETIRKEFYFVNKEGDVDKFELTIEHQELQRFVENCRKIQAKANRLCSTVEILDRQPDVQDFDEFSYLVFSLQQYLSLVKSFLGLSISHFIDFENMKSTSNITDDPGMIKIFEDYKQAETMRNFCESLKK